MNIPLTDSIGQELVLTTEGRPGVFDAVTCSPHAHGFVVLNSFIRRSVPRAQIQAACDQAVVRNEVCILPIEFTNNCRVLLTPTIRHLGPGSRLEASQLMIDLFHASQTAGVNAESLLITHFAHVGRYPEPHVLGIFDAIKELGLRSYQNLKVLCIEIRPQHLPQFEASGAHFR